MTLSTTQMQRLQRQSEAFRDSGCETYFQAAMTAVKESKSPSAALWLFDALRKGARRKQESAIEDVRRWIKGRIAEEPTVSAEQFVLELGWLRRMYIARKGGCMPASHNGAGSAAKATIESVAPHRLVGRGDR